MAFEAIKQLTNRVAKLDEGQILKAYVSNKKIQEFILNLNRVDQLFVDGIQSDGNPLTSGSVTGQTTPGVYSKYTEKINQGKSFSFGGQSKGKIAGERYFLYNEGEFFSTFVIIPLDDGFEIDANPIKQTDDGPLPMFEEYGKNILGLTDESLQKFIDAFKEVVSVQVRKKLGLL
tara:strand:- start:73 stop:597 length:525 start_codon:yes stop_codon:yes gene_type:complete